MNVSPRLIKVFEELGLEDLLTHFTDFQMAVSMVARSGTLDPDDQLYWQHQVKVLNDLKLKVERALPVDDKG